ncbi:DUF1841 family protein [Candidatus Ruthturnera calyptogenae]
MLTKTKDPHETKHKMINCIVQIFFSEQKNNTPMDYQSYVC